MLHVGVKDGSGLAPAVAFLGHGLGVLRALPKALLLLEVQEVAILAFALVIRVIRL